MKTPLHHAAEGGNFELVRLLLRHGAKIDVRNGQGEQPLHYAAKNGNTQVVELLLDNGASPNAGKFLYTIWQH